MRSQLNEGAAAELLRAAIQRVDPSLPVVLQTMDSQVDRFFARPRFQTVLLSVFAATGLILAAIGLYGLVSFLVVLRTREIGIRKAVGARRREILAQVLVEAMTLTGTGGVIGILVGSLISLAVRTFLPALPSEVSLIWVVAAFSVSVGVGLFFGIYPAKRAAELDPIVSLRYE